MEIRKLCAKDYDELLSLLNGVFANKYRRDMDFLNEQPGMWVRDDEHMSKHIGIFEDGRLASVVGVYPLAVNILGKELLFATTGNVATLPEYEGRGYFTKLFSLAMEEIRSMGVDAARLGGARQRYARFGFEPAGLCFKIEFNSDNANKPFKAYGEGVEFERITKDHAEGLNFISEIIKAKRFYVKRSDQALYPRLSTKHSAVYLAKRDGKPIGYLCTSCDNQYVGVGENGRNVNEYGYINTEDFFHMITAYQRKVGQTLNITLAPHETELLQRLSDGAEYASLVSPSRFKVLNYEKLADALVKLKDRTESLSSSEAVIEIEDYGRLRIYKSDDKCGAELTDKTADITLTRAEATRLLFGHLPYFATKNVPANLRSFLPLPLSWNTLDYV